MCLVRQTSRMLELDLTARPSSPYTARMARADGSDEMERAVAATLRSGFAACCVALGLTSCVSSAFFPESEQAAHRLEPQRSVAPAWYLSAPPTRERAETQVYSTTPLTAPQPRGGAAELVQQQLMAQFAERNDSPLYDGRLARVGAMLLGGAARRRFVAELPDLEQAAERVGYAGMILSGVVGDWNQPAGRAAIAGLVSHVPNNRAINRYAVVAGRGGEVAVLLGNVEVELEDFPNAVAPDTVLRLRGAVADRYERGSVFVTRLDGTVREYAMAARAIDVALEFSGSGSYRVEIMGYGATGPVVLMNVPIQVGAELVGSRPPIQSSNSGATTAEYADLRVLDSLNEARRAASLSPLSNRPELRAVALAHSLDMQQNGFFGHVSPSTGTLQERSKRAKLRASKLGECVASNRSPKGVVASLLNSPAHRATILDPAFDSVGIGTVLQRDSIGQSSMIVTAVLARVPLPEAARLSAVMVLETLQALRKEKNLPPFRVDVGLGGSAHVGSRAASGTPEAPLDVRLAQGVAGAMRELRKFVKRRGSARKVCFSLFDIIERQQLDIASPMLLDLDAQNIGVGVMEVEGAEGPRLNVFLALEGKPGKQLECR